MMPMRLVSSLCVQVLLLSSLMLSSTHRSERRGERVTRVYDLPLQGRVDGADKHLESRLVKVFGKVLLFRHQHDICESGLRARAIPVERERQAGKHDGRINTNNPRTGVP